MEVIAARSYIKLYGPSISKGIKKLNSLMGEFHIEKETRGYATRGDFDFVFEWISKEPNKEDIEALISAIDKALSRAKCSYTITTLKE